MVILKLFQHFIAQKRISFLSHTCFSNIRARLGVIKSSVMKGIVLSVFDGNISFLSVFRSRQRQSTQNQMQIYSSPPPPPPVLVFYQSVKIEKFLHFMYFSVCEKETLLFLLMNLLTGPALALRSSEFEISTYHSSQLTEHETCQEHYGELENFIS